MNPVEILWLSGGEGGGGGFICNHVQKDLRCGPAPCCGRHPAPPLLLDPASPLSRASLVLEQAKSQNSEVIRCRTRVFSTHLKKILQS